MTNLLWGPEGTVVNLLTTQLDALVTGAGSAYGPAIDNTSNRWQWGRLALKLASNSLAFTVASSLTVLLVPSQEGAGTNYPTYTSGSSYKLAVNNYPQAALFINPATQSANVVYENTTPIFVPSGFYKAILISAAGVTLPATLNTLDMYPTPPAY